MTPATGNVSTRRTLDADGNWVETPVYKIDGRVVSEAEFRAVFPEREGCPFVPGGGAWPMFSDATACHPKQIPAMLERNRRHGVNVTYTDDGTAVIPSRLERKKLNKLEGFFDKDGGYSD